MSPVLSIVMPAHNEEGLLKDAVDEVVAGLRARGHDFELVVVENGSADSTVDVAKHSSEQVAELRVLSLPTADYGRALKEGLLAARGSWVVTFDVDYVDLGFLDDALTTLMRDGAAIVVGSKRAAGAGDNRPRHRQVVTWAFSTALRLGFGLRVSDTHGMKAMDREAVLPLVRECRFGTDLFDTELVLTAERGGLRVAELPVRAVERRPTRSSIARRALRSSVGLVRLWVSLRRR